MKSSSASSFRKHLGLSALFLLWINMASAQLASWEVTGVNAGATNPFSASSLGSNISSASLSLGSGVTASSSNATFGGSAFNQTSLASAITNGDYISFTITPGAGFKLSLSSISFNSGVSTAVTNFNGSLLSSATGFTSSDSLYSYSFSTTGAANQSVTLSGVTGLQNITGTLEFRLYGFRDTTGTSTYFIRNLSGSDLVINGTLTAVPEPSTYALLGGIASLALVGARRVHSRRSHALGKALVSG